MAVYIHPDRPGEILWHRPIGVQFVTQYPSINGPRIPPRAGDTVTIARARFNGAVASNETITLGGVDIRSSATDTGNGTYTLTLPTPGVLEYAAIRPTGPRVRAVTSVTESSAAGPSLIAPIPDQSLTVGDANATLALGSYFANASSYAVSPTGQGVTISGSTLTISAAAVRNANYTVTASNSTGQTVSDTFALVAAAAVVTPTIADIPPRPRLRGFHA